MYLRKIFSLVMVLLALNFATKAQVTTGTITGVVKAAADKVVLANANIEAIHEPTGTKYSTQARKDGRFDLPNVNGGGPYTLKASYSGFETETISDVFVTVGDNQVINFNLKDSRKAGATATVVATRPAAGARNGSETTIGRDRIANGPSVGRNISDFVRFTPQAQVRGDGGISIAGQNNRFNSFLIDGATNNDVFGLSNTGTNGGQAGTPPISIDAIDQISVKVSDFDASIGNYTGGAINATTRGGTNNVTGSVYTYFRNESLTGRAPIQSLKPGSLTNFWYAPADKFQNLTTGARIGFPLIKNKLFAFVNVEKQKDERPQPFDPASYRGSSLGDGTLNSLISYLKTTHGYDPGQYQNNPDLIDRINVNTRFDWNVNDKNKLTASYRYTDVERINPGRSSANSINFNNGAQLFPSVTHSGSIELNTKFSNKSNNKFRISFTDVNDDRGYTGKAFPGVQIFDGTANINFGNDISSTANLLKQTTTNFFNIYKKYVGNHSLSAGFDIDLYKAYNLFINRAHGFYQFNSIDTFLAGGTPNRYRSGFSLVDGGKVGDAAVNAAAEFKSTRLGFFINDDIKVNSNLTLTLGLRADQLRFLTDAPVDAFWRDFGAAQIAAAGYDIEGAVAGKLPQARFMFSPRFGFKYTTDEDGITFRGGTGLFTGRTPQVWPGGVYQNTGVTIGAVDINNQAQLRGLGVVFNSNVNTQPTAQQLFGGAPLPSGDLNLIAKDYKVPMNWRTTLGAEKKLGNGWNVSVEGTFTKNIYETDWQNLAITKTNIITTGGVGPRQIITGDPLIAFTRPVGANPRPYTGIYLIRNTPSATGFSYNFVAQLDKAFAKNWSFNLQYSYGSSFVNNEGTSSVNASNWINMEKVGNRNTMVRSVSDFALGSKIQSYASKKFNYAKGRLATTATLVYTGQSGSPISYTISGNGFVNDGATNNDLVYIPASRAEVSQMLFSTNTVNGITYSAVQQQDAFWSLIQNNKYLKSRMGQFTERNGSRTPFTNQIDLKLQQDFNFKVKGRNRSFQVALDMFNFTNFLNPNWGRQYFTSFDQIPILSPNGLATGNIPQYRFTPLAVESRPWNFSDGVTPFNNSRWVGQLTVRFNF
jgi:hypothetical protein